MSDQPTGILNSSGEGYVTFQTGEQQEVTIASQAAQIERLREALITIAGPPERDPDLPLIYQPRWSVEQSRYIARAALQPKEGGQ
jgi:hypothetical protein